MMLTRIGNEKDNAQVTSSIYEALMMIRAAYNNPLPAVSQSLQSLLLANVEKVRLICLFLFQIMFVIFVDFRMIRMLVWCRYNMPTLYIHFQTPLQDTYVY
jgi:hypothetical protein